MKLTDHARQRLRERFKITDEGDIQRICRRLEKDFIKEGFTENGDPFRVIIWKGAYLEGVLKEGVIVTIINRGWTPVHIVDKLKYKRGKNGKSTIY